jgi:Zn-dependent metalloprotease
MGTTTASLEPCGSVLADVFGIVFKQHRANDEKEWKIGTKIFRPAVANAECFRNPQYPGTAYSFIGFEQVEWQDRCLGHVCQRIRR